MSGNEYGRRQYLNKVGSLAVLGPAAAGVARADRSGLDTRSATDAGIDEAVANLVDERKYEQARRLLERHDRYFPTGMSAGAKALI
ncbi:hypothetical protein [Natronorubrum thiooxidans]|uniref:Uncharacterized protein n=1 Tax=Natronorubrum thiooxidans TaxID=308853 RepID=A0A1N7H9H6_9EURY|nr:hypothetical protein [Natronorubrum thiooxidans]SIS21318.1 hypothetical protein SAMN05421752_1351 [Natronorubrum thiooxidans]